MKRMYDDKRRKRLLYVEITTWYGLSIGAKHYYAKIYEDDNPVWQKNNWVYSSEDKDCKGRSFGGIMDTSFNLYNHAIDWVVDMWATHFPNHKLHDVSGGLITVSQLNKVYKNNFPEK